MQNKTVGLEHGGKSMNGIYGDFGQKKKPFAGEKQIVQTEIIGI